MKEFIFEHCETGEVIKIQADVLKEAHIALLREIQPRFIWSDILIDEFEKFRIMEVHRDG